MNYRRINTKKIFSEDVISRIAAAAEEGYASFEEGRAPRTASRRQAQEGYQGWSNYETWAVALWLDNDYGMYQMIQEEASTAEDAYSLGQSIKGLIEEGAPQLDGVYGELLTGALQNVDWREIAQNLMTE